MHVRGLCVLHSAEHLARQRVESLPRVGGAGQIEQRKQQRIGNRDGGVQHTRIERTGDGNLVARLCGYSKYRSRACCAASSTTTRTAVI